MKARDVMVSPVITMKPASSVRDAARTLLERRISALPVADDKGKLVGIISEGDLMRRTETGTEHQRSWWLRFLAGEETAAGEYAKSHARRVADVMTRYVITADPDAPLNEIATLFEKHAIKRVPIIKDGQLVGIVSRSNLVQAVASAPKELEIPLSDQTIRDKLLAHLRAQPWSHTWQLNVTVNRGVVDLWGVSYSDGERAAIRVAAENIPGVRAVNDHLFVRHPAEIEI
jgi:CBS-domain-containing membrane protein